MLDTFTPDQKAAILASIMVDEAHGVATRQACQSQGITLQTYLDWKAHARKTLTVPHNGPRFHPERDKRRPREREKTAFELAFEAAKVKTYPSEAGNTTAPPPDPVVPHKDVTEWHGLPEDNPEDLHALAVERGEALPAPVVEALAPVEPKQPDSGPENAPQVIANEDSDMAKKKCPDYSYPEKRGIAAAMYAANPFLWELDQQTFDALGPRPDKDTEKGAYNNWVKYRKALMSPAQVEQFEGFFGGSRKGRTKATGRPTKAETMKEQAEMFAGNKGGIETEQIEVVQAAPTRARKARAQTVEPPPMLPINDAIRGLIAEHETVTTAIANHEATGLAPVRAVRTQGPLDTQALVMENQRLKTALTALTLENLQLRGLL